MGLFGEKYHYLAKIIEALNEYPERFEGEQAWQELGRPTITLPEYAQQAV
ncbi:hypothetical protein ADICEAN_04023 [Cesiribacter andamanensis AMV16]|uniref:Uncharacterized protein n=1 Tax=Cesiribacter andamanensis AMV16 TaxID=1279009 RepID=M7N0X9_9BACT|nr:hypothetical protein ADICEAN_04023 [Cesiribacter andamanensis AMV16]